MRENPVYAEKYKEGAMTAAKELTRCLMGWDRHSGRQNAKQLHIQLARFIKKNA